MHLVLAEGATRDVTTVWLLDIIVGRTWGEGKCRVTSGFSPCE